MKPDRLEHPPFYDLLLRPFQCEGVEKMLKFLHSNAEHAVYNASEPGLGKSAMTIQVINHLCGKTLISGGKDIRYDAYPTLIICPSVVKLSWKEEIEKWNRRDYAVSCWIINSSGDLKNQSGLSDFTIISYDLAKTSKVTKWLAKQSIGILVLDEAHYVKSLKAQRTKAVLKEIWPRAKYRICLSGTPFTSSIEDCYSTFSKIAPTIFPNWFNFVNTFCYCENSPWGKKYYGSKNPELLNKIIYKHFFIRYEKKKVAPELPPKIWSKISLGREWAVKETPEERKEWEVYIQLLESAIGEGKAIPLPPKHLATIRREQSLKKLPEVIEYVKNLVDNKVPTVVFCCYLDVLYKLRDEFKQNKPGIIYGAIPDSARKTDIDRFENCDTDLMIMQINSGGIGINLKRGEHVVLAELDYSPAIIEQGVNRCHRMTTDHIVNISYFVTEGTIEEDIAKAVMTKDRMFSKVLKNDN